MIVYGLDPGSSESALVGWDSTRRRPFLRVKRPNAELFAALEDAARTSDYGPTDPAGKVLVIEASRAYTLPGGRDARFMPQQVLETAWISGAFARCWEHELAGQVATLDRRKVKLHLLGRASGTDAHVRAALLELVGPQGTKAAPGPTFGMRADLWAALGVAYVWCETGPLRAVAAGGEEIEVGRGSSVGSDGDRPW